MGRPYNQSGTPYNEEGLTYNGEEVSSGGGGGAVWEPQLLVTPWNALDHVHATELSFCAYACLELDPPVVVHEPDDQEVLLLV